MVKSRQRRDEPAAPDAISRRRFLRNAALAGVGLGAAGLVSGCGSSSSGGDPKLITQGLAWPSHPVAWPLEGHPIASGLAPEKDATLQIYNWVAYLSPQVVK